MPPSPRPVGYNGERLAGRGGPGKEKTRNAGELGLDHEHRVCATEIISNGFFCVWIAEPLTVCNETVFITPGGQRNRCFPIPAILLHRRSLWIPIIERADHTHGMRLGHAETKLDCFLVCLVLLFPRFFGRRLWRRGLFGCIRRCVARLWSVCCPFHCARLCVSGLHLLFSY